LHVFPELGYSERSLLDLTFQLDNLSVGEGWRERFEERGVASSSSGTGVAIGV
jgi:hypothetical protein